MESSGSGYSPNILIYLEIGEKKIRLADVMGQSATLYEVAEVRPDTEAILVFVIDGEEEREEVLLKDGIALDSQIIRFSYTNGSSFKNGRIIMGLNADKTTGAV